MRRSDMKWGNLPVTIDGFSFQSTIEGARYLELKFMEQCGAIRDLRRQVSMNCLDVQGKKVCRYIADFVYVDVKTNKEVVEDVKGRALEMFKIKNALLMAQGIEVKIIKANDIAKWAKDSARDIRDRGRG